MPLVTVHAWLAYILYIWHASTRAVFVDERPCCLVNHPQGGFRVRGFMFLIMSVESPVPLRPSFSSVCPSATKHRLEPRRAKFAQRVKPRQRS